MGIIMLPCADGTHASSIRTDRDLPVQRGNVSLSNQQVLNAILYVAEHGCKWRGLPARFGNWHTLYTRMNRWSKNGVLDRVFEHLQREQIVRVKLEAVSLDSTIVQVHPDGTGALKKTVPKPSADPAAVGPPRFIWLPRMLERPSPSRSPRQARRSRRASAAESPWSATRQLADQARMKATSTPWLWHWGYTRRATIRFAARPMGIRGRCTSGATKSNACFVV